MGKAGQECRNLAMAQMAQETEEAENDVAGLSLSFLTVQAPLVCVLPLARSSFGEGPALCHQRHPSQPGGHGTKMSMQSRWLWLTGLSIETTSGVRIERGSNTKCHRLLYFVSK